jgi:O-methyltransferase involved in polyketide biosynthesis
VDSTLAFVANHSGLGSAIIFDYMYTFLLDGTVNHGEVNKMRRDRWLSNEVLAFGIPEGAVTAFLEQRGFTQVHDANYRYLHDTYFTDNNASRTVADSYAIASAVVKPRAAS